MLSRLPRPGLFTSRVVCWLETEDEYPEVKVIEELVSANKAESTPSHTSEHFTLPSQTQLSKRQKRLSRTTTEKNVNTKV